MLALGRMRVDIFPSLNTPKIYVFFDFIGMSPDQIEGFIVNELELYFQYVDGIEDIKSRNIQQVGLCELGFFHDTDMGQAMAQVVAMSDRAMAWMPPGSLPPMIMRMDQGSVPIGYLVFTSEGDKTSIGAMGDLAQNIIRPLVQKNVPGTVAISPFGPNMRSIIINVDPQKLLEYNLNPKDLVDAIAQGNVVIPSGNIYIKDSMPIVHNNATVVDIKRLGDIPIKLGQNVYIRDVASIQDDTDITYGYALVNGKKAIHLPIIKKDTGSTLTVVSDVHKSLEKFRAAVPPDVKIEFEFDESPTVVHAVESVATEGAIGAVLTGLMILLFLRDLRSVLVVVANIPLALTGSLFGLWVTQNTINIMSLGGMALAIGILVDEATVTIENTHVQMEQTPKIATAVLKAANATAVPRLLALLCILSVFIPAFVMEDPLRALFMPLTLAVGFAMISSYLLSSTLVPIMSVYLLKHKKQEKKEGDAPGSSPDQRGLPQGSRMVHQAALYRSAGVRGRVLLRPGRSGPGSRHRAFPTDRPGGIRPAVPSAGRLQLRAHSRNRCEVPAGNRKRGGHGEHRDHHGLRRPGRTQLRHRQHGALHARTGRRLAAGQAERRQRHQARSIPRAAAQGSPRACDPLAGPPPPSRRRHRRPEAREAQEQANRCTFGFEPGDIVSQVMSFGASKPIAIQVIGTDYDLVRQHAEKIAAGLKNIEYLRDVGFEQTLDYPTVEVNIDRELAGLIGVTPMHVMHALVMSTSSTRFTNLNYWINEKTGFDYLVQLQVPPLRMEKPEDIEELPLQSVNSVVPLMVRDVLTDGSVHTSMRPGEFDRDMSQRYVTVIANVHGEDMGRAAKQVRKAVDDAGLAPRGVHVEEQAQLPKMTQMFEALGIGLSVAVFVIFLLLTAYFQSPRLALISLGAVPGVLAGIVMILLVTKTTLNIESFMGSIMCLGVSVSNSVMMVTFMDEHWKAGKSSIEAALVGASERLRPILMTACAMTVGMVPMALAFERGSQMEAPLGRAVIGGLVMSTFATLLVLPAIFALVIGQRQPRSPSLYPGNRASSHFDPEMGSSGGGEQEQNNQNGARRTRHERGQPQRFGAAYPRFSRGIECSWSWPCSPYRAAARKRR